MGSRCGYSSLLLAGLAVAASFVATCCVILLAMHSNIRRAELEESDLPVDPLFAQAQAEQEALPGPGADVASEAVPLPPDVAQAQAEQDALPTPPPLGMVC